MEEIKTKVCSKCGEEKDIDLFSKDKSKKDGRYGICKECRSKDHQNRINKVNEYRINNKERLKDYSAYYRKMNRNKISDYMKVYRKVNNEKINVQRKQYKEENREELNRLAAEHTNRGSMFSSYAHQLTVEEDPIEGENGELLVRCAHCREYFNPLVYEVGNRIQALKGKQSGEQRLYCSDQCKRDCDIYYANSIPKSLRNVAKQARCSQNTNKKALLDLQIDECGYNYCEKCGTKFEAGDLIIHHNIMVSKDHTEADNMSHQILVCKDHHEHKGC